MLFFRRKNRIESITDRNFGWNLRFPCTVKESRCSSADSKGWFYTYDASTSTSTSTSITHVWTGTTQTQAQAQENGARLCLRRPGSHVAYARARACAYAGACVVQYVTYDVRSVNHRWHHWDRTTCMSLPQVSTRQKNITRRTKRKRRRSRSRRAPSTWARTRRRRPAPTCCRRSWGPRWSASPPLQPSRSAPGQPSAALTRICRR